MNGTEFICPQCGSVVVEDGVCIMCNFSHPVSIKKLEMIKGGRYNWKNQKERLIYLGEKWYPNYDRWHQFALVESPFKVWCEVLDDDLEMFEKSV